MDPKALVALNDKGNNAWRMVGKRYYIISILIIHFQDF